MFGHSIKEFMSNNKVLKWKENLSKASLGKHWFNNGIIEVFCYECPSGFISGRLKMKQKTKDKISKTMQKLIWINNGIK